MARRAASSRRRGATPAMEPRIRDEIGAIVAVAFALLATVALATDCNPGSGFSTSMPLAVALAVREMRMTPAEAVSAATAGGAQALRRTDIGSLRVGSRADLVVLDAPSYVHLAYRPGVPLVSTVWRRGRPV